MPGPKRHPPGAPDGQGPVLVAAFAGWNDAGEAASTAVRHLIDRAGHMPHMERPAEVQAAIEETIARATYDHGG